jgi:hypothetical protein
MHAARPVGGIAPCEEQTSRIIGAKSPSPRSVFQVCMRASCAQWLKSATCIGLLRHDDKLAVALVAHKLKLYTYTYSLGSNLQVVLAFHQDS